MLTTEYLFGKQSNQDSSFLYIDLNDYPGFSDLTNPDGQKILALLVKQWIRKFFGYVEDSEDNFLADHNENKVTFDHSLMSDFYISLARESVVYKNGKRYLNSHVKVSFQLANDGTSDSSFEASDV